MLPHVMPTTQPPLHGRQALLHGFGPRRENCISESSTTLVNSGDFDRSKGSQAQEAMGSSADVLQATGVRTERAM
jgi:hypothetical protein